MGYGGKEEDVGFFGGFTVDSGEEGCEEREMRLWVYIMVRLDVMPRLESLVRTVDVFGYLYSHLDQPQLIDPVLKVAHESFECIDAKWSRQWLIKELE